jgi:hypothetical protein
MEPNLKKPSLKKEGFFKFKIPITKGEVMVKGYEVGSAKSQSIILSQWFFCGKNPAYHFFFWR